MNNRPKKKSVSMKLPREYKDSPVLASVRRQLKQAGVVVRIRFVRGEASSAWRGVVAWIIRQVGWL